MKSVNTDFFSSIEPKQDYTNPELVEVGRVTELTAATNTGAFRAVPFGHPVHAMLSAEPDRSRAKPVS